MLVFISWSGARSKAVAEALESWLAQVIQAVEPWISQDISKGLRWGPEISSRLESSKVGIICLTKSNLDARWIHFEAGALSKTKDAYVCTLLLGIKPSDVEQPLAQFQHTTTEKEDIYQLLSTINLAVEKSGEKALAEAILRKVFETYWPDLEKAFNETAALIEAAPSPSRSTEEMLQEVLEILRNQERRQSHSLRPKGVSAYTLNHGMAVQRALEMPNISMQVKLIGDDDKVNSFLSNEKLANSLLDYGMSQTPDGAIHLTLHLNRVFSLDELTEIAKASGLLLTKISV